MARSSFRPRSASRTRVAASALSALTLAAGFGALTPVAAVAASRQAPLQTLVVGIPVYPPKLAHVAIYIAQDQGFLRREGLKVKIVGFQGGPQTLRGAASGYIDIAFGGSDDGLAAAATPQSGVVTIWDQTQSLDTVALGNVPSVKDVKGKYVAVNGIPGFAYTQVMNVLSQNGLTAKDVKFVDMSRQAMVSALATHRVAMGIFHADDALAAEQADPGVHILDVMYKTLPHWWYGATLVNKKWADAHRSEVVRFLEAMILADRWMYTHKAQVIKDAAGPTGESPAILAKAYDVLHAAQTWTVNTGLYQPWMNETIKAEVKYQEIPHYINPKSFVDYSFVDAALKAVGRVSWGKP
jgi:ABC-type nitrate/sulfonate/bicarbonate transport system substrate-binding protein